MLHSGSAHWIDIPVDGHEIRYKVKMPEVDLDAVVAENGVDFLDQGVPRSLDSVGLADRVSVIALYFVRIDLLHWPDCVEIDSLCLDPRPVVRAEDVAFLDPWDLVDRHELADVLYNVEH